MSSEVERAIDAVYASVGASPAYERILREVYGEEHQVGVEPFNYLRASDLARIARELRVAPRRTFLDAGCGRGGPGLWVARETGANVVGVDLSPAGVDEARRRAGDFLLAERARFEVADLRALPLDDETLDGAISMAVLWMIPEPERAVAEIRRVLRPGARFVFTSWDRDRSPPRAPAPIPDHRVLLERAGFSVERYDELDEVEARRRRVYELVRERRDALAREMPQAAVGALLFEAERALGFVDGTDYLAHSRAVLAVALKSPR